MGGSYQEAVQWELSKAHNGAAIKTGVASRMMSLAHAMHKPGYFEPLCTARHLSVRFYDWEPSRYVGDVAHLIALGLCLCCLLREAGTEGVSFKAHLLFFFVFSSRFLNVFFCEQPIYLVIYKVLLWQGTLMIVMLMCLRGSIQDKKDTLPLTTLFIPIFVATLVFGKYSTGDHGLVAEILWFFSNYLEGMAMLPQYIYCYRDIENAHPLVLSYVLAMGAYQGIFGLHWMFRLFFGEDYLDMSSIVNGFLGVIFFADYVIFKVMNGSPLSRCCIMVDKGLQDVREEMSICFREARKQLTGAAEFDMIPTSPISPHSPQPAHFGKGGLEEVELA